MMASDKGKGKADDHWILFPSYIKQLKARGEHEAVERVLATVGVDEDKQADA